MNIFDLKELSEKEEIVKILACTLEDSYFILTAVSLLEKNENIIKNQRNTNNKKLQLTKGDTVLINRGERHRVSYTSKNPCCIWICIFFK